MSQPGGQGRARRECLGEQEQVISVLKDLVSPDDPCTCRPEKSARDALNWFLRRKGVTAPIIGAWSIWKITSGPSAIEYVYPYRMIREMQQV